MVVSPRWANKKNSWIFKQIQHIAERYNFKLTDAIKDIPKPALDIILNGGKESFEIESKIAGVKKSYKIDFEGIMAFITNQYNNAESTSIKR
jgi:Excinuclease ATPase subunit